MKRIKSEGLDRKRPILLTEDQTAMIFTNHGHMCVANHVEPTEGNDDTAVPDTNKMLGFCAWAMRQGILKVLFMNEIKRIKNKGMCEELDEEELELLSVILGSEITKERMAEVRRKYKESHQSDD